MFKNKRKEKRYTIKHKGIFAVFEPNDIRMGHIIDINSKGLGFSYIDTGREINPNATFEISIPTKNFNLKNIPLKTVIDHEENNLEHAIIERCGIEFGKLTPNQLKLIFKIIKNNCE